MYRNIVCIAAVGIALLLPWPDHPLAAQPSGSDYRMRVVVTRDRKEANVRFNFKTGESWLISVNRTTPVKESASVPEGSYDVTVQSGETSWWAFRIERRSGKAWNLAGAGQWFEFVEPAAVPEGEYEIQALCQADSNWVRRFDRVSGRLWYGKWTGKAYEWVEMGLESPAPVPPAPMPLPPPER
jgi:hypothetical protein